MLRIRDPKPAEARRRNSHFAGKVRKKRAKTSISTQRPAETVRTKRRPRVRAPRAAPRGSTRPSPSATCAAPQCRSPVCGRLGWIQIRTLTSPPASSPNTMPILSAPSMATNQTASSACTRPTAARISSSRSPAGAPDPSPAARTSSVRAAKMSRSASAENGRSSRLSPWLGCRSPVMKLSSWFRSSSSSRIRRRDTLVSRSKDNRSTASPPAFEVPSMVRDRFDGRVVVLGLDDDVEQLMPPFERADQACRRSPCVRFSAHRRSCREA